ncbi:hypothetical protein VE03_05570 [Pseudogymnoascus sp. 23342-1-I1]|nr:hypothetical protein VE03_05570 [Pseudogymnoascus sp. 23342-1-I1]
MSAPSNIEKVPPVEGEMNNETASATSNPVTATDPMEIDTAINQPVTATAVKPSTSEEAPAPAEMDSGAQPSTSYSTIFVNHNESDDSDDDFPVLGRKRKRNSTNVDYLADMANGAEPKEASEKKPGWTWKGTQGPTWKGHEVKHGVPIGVWSLSDEPVDERKHVLFGFLDPKFALHGRKYPERKDGSKYTGNFPSGTGTWAAKADEWLLDPHLQGLNRKELTEYVRIRMATWKRDEVPQERDALDKSAVVEAKKIAAASLPIMKSENKGSSARKSKKGTSRKSNGDKFDNRTPRESFGEPSSSNNNSTTNTPLGKREKQAPATSNGSPLGKRTPREPKMASPIPKSTPNALPSNHGSPSQPEIPQIERSKFVVMGKDVLLGYWKDSSEPEVINKHGMYGVIQAHGVFRVKVVPETRYGRHISNGNYPKQSGGCWVSYDTIIFEKYLKDLVRTEIEEYCRICVVDPEYNNGIQGPAIDRAIKEAKRRVAERAAEKGMNIIEYNRKRVDQLEQGAIAREAEKQRKTGEVVVKPPKVEVRPTAKRSDKAASDARAQMVRLARKEAKEARERETLNSRGDADLAEAMRRSTSEQEALGAKKKASQNSAAPPATPGAETSWARRSKDLPSSNNSLRQGSGTPMPEANGGNSSESETVKFCLLDRETQRVKMERWCQLKPTSQYHTMDREGQKRHVEKHIDQLIARQTGAAPSRRPKKRSRTGDYPGPSSTQPGSVTAPSPLADMTRASSTPAKSATTSQEPAATFATADTTRTRNGPVNIAPAPSTAPQAAPTRSYSRTESPAAKQEVPSEPGARRNLTLRSVLNEPITPIHSENEVTPQPKPVENTADVQMVDAPIEAPAAPVQPVTSNSTPQAESRAASANPVATVETQPLQAQPPTTTIQPPPIELAPKHQFPAPTLYESTPSHSPTPFPPSHDTTMSDTPLNHHDPTLRRESQILKLQFASHLQQQLFTTPQQNPARALTDNNAQGFMSAPPRPYVTPYPTPPTAAAAPATAPIPRAAPPPAAPEILTGHDGVKYSVDPSSEFGELLVSVDRDLVDVEDEEYTRQLVLVAKKAPRPARGKGEEVRWGEEVFRRAGEGVFGGFLVGGERKVTRVGGEDYVRFVVLVPF